jgi:hypothetical protein
VDASMSMSVEEVGCQQRGAVRSGNCVALRRCTTLLDLERDSSSSSAGSLCESITLMSFKLVACDADRGR